MLQTIFYLNRQGKRKNIEDHLYPYPGEADKNSRLFIVCDGVGGESKGEEASRIVCETLGLKLNKQSAPLNIAVIENACLSAVDQLRAHAAIHPEAANMSTTLTLAYLQTNGIWTAWCGDSRIYHIRNGKALWRTRDHSLVEQLIRSGEITEEEARQHPKKNVILRCLTAASANAPIQTHFIKDIQKGDYLLLCTDGLLEQINEPELFTILNDSQTEKDKTKLFLKYCEDKTNDNFSMYLISLNKNITEIKKTRIIKYIMGAILLVCLVLLLLFFKDKKKDNSLKKSINTEKKDSPLNSGTRNAPLPVVLQKQNDNRTTGKDTSKKLNIKPPTEKTTDLQTQKGKILSNPVKKNKRDST